MWTKNLLTVCRVKVLCMWYNLTVQLNRKIEMLGQILIGKFLRDYCRILFYSFCNPIPASPFSQLGKIIKSLITTVWKFCSFIFLSREIFKLGSGYIF
jgi:hypothetical protein